MSTTGPLVVTQVQRILQESTPDDPVVAVDIIQQRVNPTVALLCGPEHLNIGSAWVTSILPLVAGTDEYELTTGSEYERILDLRYASDRAPLLRRTYEFVASLRAGSEVAAGRPQYIALRHGPDQHVSVIVWPKPTDTENVDGLVTIVPTTWAPTDVTAPTIPFSTRATRALELLIAAEVARTFGQDKLTALDLNPRSFDGWERTAWALVKAERLSIWRLKVAHGPYDYEWVRYWSL